MPDPSGSLISPTDHKDVPAPLLTGTEADASVTQYLNEHGGDRVSVIGGDQSVPIGSPNELETLKKKSESQDKGALAKIRRWFSGK